MNRVIMLMIVTYFSISLFAQEPILKIYYNNGNSKQFNINEIKNLFFIHSNLSYSIIFYKYSIEIAKIDIRNIDSIIFENKQTFKIILLNETRTYNLTDIDSIIFTFNTCTEIRIGNQLWMCKNLDVDHYRNGDPIRQAQTEEEWIDAAMKGEGAWCYYDNNDSLGKIYGKLYNWYAVNDLIGIAPEGWHVPTDKEWKELEIYLGMSPTEANNSLGRGTDQGSQLAGRSDLWLDGGLENNANFGSSGFFALPGGYRDEYGIFKFISKGSYWWSSTDYDAYQSWIRDLKYNFTNVNRTVRLKWNGFSVRCVRD